MRHGTAIWRLAAAAAAALVAACQQAEHRLVLVYPDAEAYERAQQVELFIGEGSNCRALEVSDTGAQLSFAVHADAPTVGAVSTGRLAVRAVVRDASCDRFLDGCVEKEVEAGQATTLRIVLQPVSGGGCPVGWSCQGGRCGPADGGAVDGAPADGGADAAGDGGTGDTGPSDTLVRDASAADRTAQPDGEAEDAVQPLDAGDAGQADAYVLDAAVPDVTPPDLNVFEPITTPAGGEAVAIAATPADSARLYARFGANHIYRSSTLAYDWRECSCPAIWTPALAVSPEDPDLVYLGVIDGLLESTDGCASWSSTGFAATARVVTVLPGGDLIVGTSAGLWRRTGTAWQAVPSVLDGYRIRDVVADPTGQVLYAASDGNGVARSEDSGATWQPANTNLTSLDIFKLAVDAQDPQHVVAACGDGVFHSTDGGRTWTETLSQWIITVAMDPSDGSHVVAVLPDRIRVSSDGGATFASSDCRSSNMNRSLTNQLVFDPGGSGTLYAAAGRGMFMKSGSGCTWTEIDRGISGWTVYGIATDAGGGDVFLATSAGVATSHDGWAVHSSGYSAYSTTLAVAIDEDDPGRLFAGAAHQLLLSTDRGQTFTYLTSAGSGWAYYVVRAKGALVYGGTSQRLYFSGDSGQTWNNRLVAGATREVEDILVLDWDQRQLLLATSSGIFFTDDDGATWTEHSSGLLDEYVYGLDRLDDGTLLAATSEGVYSAAALGSDWVALGTAAVEVYDLLAHDPVIVAACETGVYWSPDRGATWAELPGLGMMQPMALGVDGQGQLLVGTDGWGLFSAAFPQP